MKGIKITLICLVSCLNLTTSYGQSDSCILRIRYDAAFKLTKERPQLFDEMVLLIGTHSSSFFSITNVEQKQLLDSAVLATGGDLAQLLATTSRLRGTSKLGQQYVVLKNYPTAGKLTYATELLGNSCYKYEEHMPHQDWQLLEGDTIIAEYACNKATTVFRGISWTVWYAPEIALNEGPWKLCGLPGLILKAVSSHANYVFECVAIQKGKGENIAIPTKKYTNTNAADLQKMETLMATDPQEAIARLTGMRPSGGNRKKARLTPLLIEDLNRQ